MKELFIKSTIATFVIAASCFGCLKALQTYSHTGSSLLLKNVEAISDPELTSYSHYAKDYETGRGMYITEITGNVDPDIHVGLRLNVNMAASLSGRIKYELVDEWKMTCQSDMGCYWFCFSSDWQQGSNTDHLDRGCD